MERLKLEGKRFGRLVVLKIASKEEKPKDKNGKPRQRSFWICQCDCGQIVVVSGRHLMSGNTRSCGCLQKEKVSKLNFVDISGKRFGKLVVLERSNRIGKRGERYWICQCDCGTIKEIGSSHLLQGHTLSCGCIKSYGEKEIQKILENLNISYITQKSFSDLKSKKNMVLRFDFEVLYKNKKILIEYQGEQHYKKINFFGGEEGFLQRKEHDDLKRQYCKRNNIPLIEYSYNETISQEKLLNKLEECI